MALQNALEAAGVQFIDENGGGAGSAAPQVMNFHQEETYKGLIQLGQNAIRMLALTNGGALVALLALSGDLGEQYVIRIAWAAACFVAGLALIMLASIVAYVMQLSLYNETVGRTSKYKALRHRPLLAAAVLLALGSIVAFVVGAVLATIQLLGGGAANG